MCVRVCVSVCAVCKCVTARCVWYVYMLGVSVFACCYSWFDGYVSLGFFLHTCYAFILLYFKGVVLVICCTFSFYYQSSLTLTLLFATALPSVIVILVNYCKAPTDVLKYEE